jgi:hypothetical protein
MKAFETPGHFSKKKFLFLVIIVLSAFECAKVAPPVPLKSDYSKSGKPAVPVVAVTGTVVENRDSVGVQKFDESSWINLHFKGEIDSSSGGVKVFDAFGNEIPYEKEWDISEETTLLVLKPSERLDYNSVYILKLSGKEMRKIKGGYLDIDEDGKEREAVDDEMVLPFVTFKNDNSKGDWEGLDGDKIPPFVVPSLSFLLEGKSTDYIWTDVNVALSIYDYTWDISDTSITVAAVDSVTVDADNFKIIEENSGKEAIIEEIDYTDNPDSSDFGRAIIKLASNLQPESFYVLKVFGGIADSSGNKMGEDTAVVFEKRFKTFSCNHDSTECVPDTTAPLVLGWENLGTAFEVSFSELIAPESVTDSSIYIPRVEGKLFLRNECGQTSVRFVSSRRVGLFGREAFITDILSDIAGNKIKEVNYYFPR